MRPWRTRPRRPAEPAVGWSESRQGTRWSGVHGSMPRRLVYQSRWQPYKAGVSLYRRDDDVAAPPNAQRMKPPVDLGDLEAVIYQVGRWRYKVSLRQGWIGTEGQVVWGRRRAVRKARRLLERHWTREKPPVAVVTQADVEEVEMR